MAQITEEHRTTTGDSINRNIVYLVTDATGEQDAIDTTAGIAPIQYPGSDVHGNTLGRATITVSEIDAPTLGTAVNTYRTTAVYTIRYQCPKPSYDFQGVAVRATQSLETKQVYKNQTDPTDQLDFNRSIEVTSENQVQGSDVLRPSGVMTLLWHPLSTFNVGPDLEYFAKIGGMIGKVNSNLSFYGWTEEQCQLAGIVANRLDAENRWEIEMRFNVGGDLTWGTDELVPGIGGSIEPVKPFDILWMLRHVAKKERTTGGDYAAPAVIQINHERVAQAVDFKELFTDHNNLYGITTCPIQPTDPPPPT